jgi:chlorite dismutase
MPAPLLVTFSAGDAGPWRIHHMANVIGEGLPAAARLSVAEGQPPPVPDHAAWRLLGTTSNLRYTHRSEVLDLTAIQEGLGRRQATRAALIPIRKNETWWSLAQDERRAIMEEDSHHIAVGMRYLPAVARRLHHCRDLGGPFDFLTWFEYAPQDADSFEEMVRALRGTAEWKYVDREVDIRLTRE